MFIWERHASGNEYSAICSAENRVGSAKPPRKWLKPRNATGRNIVARSAEKTRNCFFLKTFETTASLISGIRTKKQPKIVEGEIHAHPGVHRHRPCSRVVVCRALARAKSRALRRIFLRASSGHGPKLSMP